MGPTAPPMLGHRPALDGLRGVAIALILVRHSAPTPFGGAGFVGVDLFFVLSGFLITTLLIEEHANTGRVGLGRFYARRALRLLPALYFMLAVYLLITAFVLPRAESRGALAWVGWAASYLTPFAQWNGAREAPGIGIVWSLAVEEYFYFVWPLIFLALFAFRLPTWVRFGVPIVLAVASAVVRWVMWDEYGARVYPMPWTWTDALLAGCLAAMAWKAGYVRRVPGWLVWISWAFLGAMSFLPGAKDTSITYQFVMILLALASAVVTLSVVTMPRIAPVQLLHWRVLRWLGKRSYAIYLWNGIFLLTDLFYDLPRIIEIPVGIALSLAIAEFSHRFIERPAQRLKHRIAIPPRAPSTNPS